MRNITTRTTLPDGSTASSAGPCVGMPPSCQPLGKYWEDYEYVAGSGDLDRYNGRFCVTPEYPSGTYCYFVTLTSSLTPQFPYIMGDSLYGVVSGTNNGIIPGSATQYIPTIVSMKEAFNEMNINVFPNPVVDLLNITGMENKKYRIILYDASGTVLQKNNSIGSFALDMKPYSCGVYVVEVVDEETGNGYLQKILK